jgi:hypothetical protein
MALVEILDGPPEWAGTVHEDPEDDHPSEIGLTHPRWRGTPLGSQRALYAYRKVEVVGDRHRYRYLGPWAAVTRRGRRPRGEDLSGWDVLVVQEELESDDPRKLWGSPVLVYTAPLGTPRPDSARPPEEQGWQELTEGGRLRRPRPAGTGAFFQERLARWMAEGNPWVVEHWRRLADKQGAAKDAEAERIEAEQSRMLDLARSAGLLRRLRPDVVVAWTSDPPFPERATYIPVIGQDLAAIPGMGYPEWVAMQDRVLLVVHPDLELDNENERVFGSATVFGAPPSTPPPDRSVAPEQQGWTELQEGDFLIAWLLHIPRWEVANR